MNPIFIGDRPAQICALVLDAPLTYTGDKSDPFAVYRMVERYVTDYHNNAAYRLMARRIVLSTGLTWAPKYDGMAAKQVNTLLQESYVTPIIFVLPVSTRILLGHAINTKVANLCTSAHSRRLFTHLLPGFEGDASYPTQPTPSEALELVRSVQNYIL
jgi:hypothetical protein